MKSKIENKTREKIILRALDLFNKNGVVAITTNHIAKDLNMSPGNLYFHFKNKEEIIHEIFRKMTKEMYQVWRFKSKSSSIHPLDLIEKNLTTFYNYRFIHRELYYIKLRDKTLAKELKLYLQKLRLAMVVVYKRWIRKGWMLQVDNQQQMEFLLDTLLLTASAQLHFNESPEKKPEKSKLLKGKKYIVRLILQFTQGEMKEEFNKFLKEN